MLTVLVIPLLNVTDLGIYIYDVMELNGAAQAAAEAALVTCGGNATTAPQLPATTTCAGLVGCRDCRRPQHLTGIVRHSHIDQRKLLVRQQLTLVLGNVGHISAATGNCPGYIAKDHW